MINRFTFPFFFILLNTLVYAQGPNKAYRLPETPDMPEWARELYQDDNQVNVFELDEAFEAWEEAYESEHEKKGSELEYHENQWEEYYKRWRAAVSPFLQPDGSLVFDESLLPVFKSKSGANKSSSAIWSLIGPFRTYTTVNDNPAQPFIPWQANIFTLDIAPSNSSVLLYGTATGLVGKSTDKGLTWTTLGLDYFVGPNMDGAAIHPSNTNIFYMGDDRGVHTSLDGGATWSQALNIFGYNCNDIKIKPDAPDIVLAAGSSLQRRTAGNIWTNILNKTTYDLAFKPDNPMIVYALVKNAGLNLCEFWKSTDGGLSFSIRSNGWITGLTDGGGRLTVTPADNNRIYALLVTGSGPRVMRSDDAGETWTIVASSNDTGLVGTCSAGALSLANGQGYYDLSIVASHTNADHIIVATTTSFKSTDGGSTYVPLGGYCGPAAIHPDIQEMIAKGGDTWIVTDGGINYSSDFFASNVEARINGMGGTDFWGFDQGWNEDVQVGGRYHNGNTAHRENYPPGDFLRMGGGEAATGYLNPAFPGMSYFSDIGGRILPDMIDQPVNTFAVSKFPNENYFEMEYGEQEWDPRFAFTYYIGKENKLWKTTDNGASFQTLFTHADNMAKVLKIEVSRTDPSVIYCTVQLAASGELWKTTNGGTTWTQCANPTGPTDAQRRLSVISMSGTDANIIWWCFKNGPNGNKIFRSTNGGNTWTNLTTATLDGVSIADMIHQLGTNGGVYLCSNDGSVYYRNNTHPDWNLYNMGLPIALYSFPSLMRLKAFYKGNKIRLSTNKGIWEAALYENSTTTLVQPMTDNAAPTCSRDTIQLESYSVVNGPATYQWAISPAPQWISNSNVRNPRIVLGANPGNYSVTLTVTDNNGTSNRTVNNLINNLANGNLCSPDPIPGMALSLDGNSDYAETGAPLNLNTNTATITAWIKRNGVQNDYTGIVFARGGNTACGISMNSDNKLRFHWNNSGWWLAPAQVVPDNEWVHVALVVTPTTSTLYVDGIGTTFNFTNGLEELDARFRIGSDAFGGRDFNGLIDEVTIWNTALTQGQIRELMHLTVIPVNQPNLVSYYQFNEPSGKANDKVSTRHASLVGNASRTLSTGPFGGGISDRQTINSGGLKTFTGTNVTLTFPAAGAYPDGEIVVSRLNVQPDSLPNCSGYASDNHYWIIDNYGNNQTFSALESMILADFMVPSTATVAPTAYRLYHRTPNAYLLPWNTKPGSSTAATGGANGSISFGNGSDITQAGQYLAVFNIPGYTNPCTSGDFIEDFTFGPFTNTGTGCSNPGTNNLTSYAGMGPNVQQSETYPVTIKAGPDWAQYYGLYIDFNRNGSYLDAGEFFNVGQAAAGMTTMTNVTIPANALLGITTMRVRSSYDAALTAADGCSTNLEFGETEDYQLTIFCPNNLAVDDVPIPNGPHNADQILTSTGQVGNGTNVTFSAENEVLLQANFEVVLGGVFEILMQGCFP